MVVELEKGLKTMFFVQIKHQKKMVFFASLTVRKGEQVIKLFISTYQNTSGAHHEETLLYLWTCCKLTLPVYLYTLKYIASVLLS